MSQGSTPLKKTERSRLSKVGLRARQLRVEKGLTLEDMEDKGFPSWKHLQAIETGRKNLTITSLFRLADALGIEATELIKGIK